jgi:toxin FitB
MILDTNIVIYSTQPQYQTIRDFIQQNLPLGVSGATYIEALGFPRITGQERTLLEALFQTFEWLDIDRPVLDRAVTLRQQRRMSLGDAIVAATALVYDRTLVTRNTADFQWITGLRLLDPLAAP